MRELVLEELLEKVTNRFILSLASARRARQIKEGAKPLVETEADEYELVTALDEILESKIEIIIEEPEEVSPIAVDEVEEKTKASKDKKPKKDTTKKKKKSLNA